MVDFSQDLVLLLSVKMEESFEPRISTETPAIMVFFVSRKHRVLVVPTNGPISCKPARVLVVPTNGPFSCKPALVLVVPTNGPFSCKPAQVFVPTRRVVFMRTCSIPCTCCPRARARASTSEILIRNRRVML